MNIPAINTLLDGLPDALGSYAPIVRDIEAALQSPQCSLARVAAAIEKDPDFTVRLLRLANSGFYAFANRVATVTEALSLIGIVQVQDLIISASIMDRFSGIREHVVDMRLFWRHSLACGIAARDLAVMRGMRQSDRFFVAGLLHDVGRLAFFAQAPALAEVIFERQKATGELLHAAEREVLGYDHADIGGALLRRWRFHDRLIEAASSHHRPLRGDPKREEVAVIHLADHLVNAMSLGTSGESLVPPLQPGVWALLGLKLTALETLVSRLDSQIEAVEGAFYLPPRPESRS